MSHLDPRPRCRPTPLPDQDEINEVLAEEGTAPEVIDRLLSSRIRSEPLKPRKWAVKGFGSRQ